MTKRFTYCSDKCGMYCYVKENNEILGETYDSIEAEAIVKRLNELFDENEQLKQQKIELLRLIDNNIEIYENINTNVEFHQGEIQGKLTLLYNLREVILND